MNLICYQDELLDAIDVAASLSDAMRTFRLQAELNQRAKEFVNTEVLKAFLLLRQSILAGKTDISSKDLCAVEVAWPKDDSSFRPEVKSLLESKGFQVIAGDNTVQVGVSMGWK